MMKQLRRVVLVFALYISGPLFLLATNPRSLPIPLLILPYIWLFAVIVCTFWLIYLILFHQQPSPKAQLNFGLVALVPVLLAVLQSIHQLSVKDIILVLGFVLVAGFYITRLDIGAAE
jgi:phosphoglycerol transferase MdoB-like AlkP superfamily enzyme